MARIYDNTSVWLTTLAAGSTTPLATMSVCNRDVRSVICLNPSIGTSCINFCVTSYADEVRLAVTVDSNLIPDPQFFTECFNQQVNYLNNLNHEHNGVSLFIAPIVERRSRSACSPSDSGRDSSHHPTTSISSPEEKYQ